MILCSKSARAKSIGAIVNPSALAVFRLMTSNAFAPAPEWLLAKFAIAAASNGNPAVAPAEWRNLVCGGVDEGQRNESIARLAGYLLRRRVDPVVAIHSARGLADCQSWPRSPSEAAVWAE